jgi:hypothetical protein
MRTPPRRPRERQLATVDIQRLAASFAELARQTRDLERAGEQDPVVAEAIRNAIDVRNALRDTFQWEPWYRGCGVVGFYGELAALLVVDRVRDVPAISGEIRGVPVVLRELDAQAMRYMSGAIDLVGAMGIDNWTDADLLTFRAMSHRLGLNPADLLLVLYSESALKPSAAARGSDGYPHAVGLNQITSILNGSLGITEEQRLDMLNWSVAEQLPYVERSLYISGATKYDFPDAGALYVLNFSPARLARGYGGLVVLYDSKTDPGAYAANKNADREKKGWINTENMRQALRANAGRPDFQAALKRYQAVTGDSAEPRIWPPPDQEEGQGISPLWYVGLAAIGTAAGVHYWRKHKAAKLAASAVDRTAVLPPPPAGVVLLPKAGHPMPASSSSSAPFAPPVGHAHAHGPGHPPPPVSAPPPSSSSTPTYVQAHVVQSVPPSLPPASPPPAGGPPLLMPPLVPST